STGVIGRFLPMDAIKSGIAEACGKLSAATGVDAARAIMTTDTVPKTAQVDVEIGRAKVRVGGMCKGSGMIHPNMATMLAYITTDAAVEAGLVSNLVKSIADRSFNQVTVDGDSSTNDSFLVLANGAAGNEPIRPGTAEAEELKAAMEHVARELSRAIARDGEGATKLITVKVEDALSDSDARTAARAVASSSLVKTAVHGGDPNWGRIVCALSYSGAELALDRLHLTVGGLVVFERGAGVDADLGAVRRAFEQPEIEIVATLGLVLLRYVGMQPVLIHGGGPEISAMIERLGLKPEFRYGLRVIDEKTMEVVKMVLIGKVSSDLVAAIHRLGGQAVGMSGEDGPTIIAEPLEESMGFVGKVTQVNKEPITALLSRGYIPDIASIGLGYDRSEEHTSELQS